MSKYLAAILIVPAAITLTGAVAPPSIHPGPPAPREVAAEKPLAVKLDLARGRRWELGGGHVLAYDMASGELLRRISLPGGIVSGSRDSCLPDMIVGRSGALIVSSNARARLWRISPARYEVEIFDLALDRDEDKDLGFGNLAWESNETILSATSSPMGTPWRIDLAAAKASRREPSEPMHASCAPARA